jgi:SAM-dependent methyltransferase
MEDIYAAPRVITELSECHFYHTTDVPGFGRVEGQWDLRGGEEDYLGRVDFGGKRVLEIGPANGFLSFHMERLGASVVSYDLSEEYDWDFVPFARREQRLAPEFKANLRKLNNAYWLCHRAFGSKGRVVYGSVYDIPGEIGPVDVTTFGSVLLHLRDPFLALERALRLTTETAVVTDLFGDPRPHPFDQTPARYVWRALRRVRARLAGPSMQFLPDARTGESNGTWWYLSPALVQRFLAVLGFEESVVTYHEQLYLGAGTPLKIQMYTVVARRTCGSDSLPQTDDSGARNPEPAGRLGGTA